MVTKEQRIRIHQIEVEASAMVAEHERDPRATYDSFKSAEEQLSRIHRFADAIRDGDLRDIPNVEELAMRELETELGHCRRRCEIR